MVAPAPPAPPPQPPQPVQIAAQPTFAKAVEQKKQVKAKRPSAERRRARPAGKALFTIKPPVNIGGGGGSVNV